MSYSDDERFEQDVRNVAAQLFPRGQTPDGRYAAGRERDGLFDDGDTVHIFEATTSRKLEKVEGDINKSASLVAELRRDKPGHNVKIWIITQSPPTADQEQAAVSGRKRARCPVEVISYASLFNRLFDARSFLLSRENWPFGSIRSPKQANRAVSREEYIKVGMRNRLSGNVVLPDEIAFLISNGDFRGIVLGDFGAGKSMALRYIYDRLSDIFVKESGRRFPVYLNLRDHFGQVDPAEALIRLATRLGTDGSNRLVGAWRAGFVDIILDGFDELSPAQFSSTSKGLKLARRAAAELVSNFSDQTPAGSSLIVSGRRHYFDSDMEMAIALGAEENWLMLDLGEFDESQVNEYLRVKGTRGLVPPWLPRRPLLLGYLAAWNLLDETILLSDSSPVDGWDYLLTQICAREVRQIPGAPVEPGNLRLLLERLATFARTLEGGRGPISAERISSTYEEIFGQAPDSRTQTLLMRLPGLASVPGAEGARAFLDDDFADACRVGDAIRYLQNPFDVQDILSGIEIEGGNIVVESLARIAQGMTGKQISNAILRACDNGLHITALDLVKGSIAARIGYDGSRAIIFDCYISDIDIFSDTDLSKIVFRDCWFESVSIMPENDAINVTHIPVFQTCVIEKLSGIANEREIPNNRILPDTKIESYVGIGQSNAEILNSQDVPLGVAVLLSLIKKLFLQAGGGRQEAALFRGLDHRARAYVPEMLQLLQRHGYAEVSARAGPPLWLAKKSKLGEARQIRDAPMTSQLPLIAAARRVTI